jgi:hypothetical protein
MDLQLRIQSPSYRKIDAHYPGGDVGIEYIVSYIRLLILESQEKISAV